MFEILDMAPPDAIMGINEAFKRDPNKAKINLSIGVYKDGKGLTPILPPVKKAEDRILEEEFTKSYLPIEGPAEFATATQTLIFGAGHAIVKEKRAVTAHTPGGTGALRVAADFIKTVSPGAKVWLSDPTWPNHPGIFESAGLTLETYPYYNYATKELDFEKMIAALRKVPKGDVVLLHGCCHNPSGMDPNEEQWQALCDVASSQGWIPFFDFAYQGLGDGLEQDAQGVRTFCKTVPEMFIANSYSKNFGLYNERVGGLTIVAESTDRAEHALSHLKRVIRTNYSNPPAHGAAIVTTVLTDAALRRDWVKEVQAMCDRINAMRGLFVQSLRDHGVEQDFSFLARQKGMFSFSGLTPKQVQRLRDEHSIYMVGNGRINVAGITENNVNTLCAAIASVLKEEAAA